MMINTVNGRTPEAEVNPIFLERWSPRAFSSKSIEDEKMHIIFEAARWAPSCFNEQPWKFLVAKDQQNLEVFRSILASKNQIWANKAPVLMFALAKKNFAYNGKPNTWAEFDTGAAWMSMALQARELGIYTHGMAGFDAEKAYELLNINRDEFKVIAAIAMGYMGDSKDLPEDIAEREKPSDRKPLGDVRQFGKF